MNTKEGDRSNEKRENDELKQRHELDVAVLGHDTLFARNVDPYLAGQNCYDFYSAEKWRAVVIRFAYLYK